MSNLDNITKKIEDDAQAKREEILAGADKKISQLSKENDKKIAEREEEIMLEAKKQAEKEKNKVISQAELAARDKKLLAKQELLDEVFSMAKDELRKISDKDYLRFVKSNLKNHNLTGNEVLVPQKGREDVLQNLDIKLAKEERVDSGFILKNGKISTNYRFDDLVDFERQELEGEVIAKLLGKE